MSTLPEMKPFFPFLTIEKTEALRTKVSNKTARTLIYFIILAFVPYLVPGLEKYQALLPNTLEANIRKMIPWSDNQMVAMNSKNSINGKGREQINLVGSNLGSNQPVGDATTFVVEKYIDSDEKLQPKPGEVEDVSGKALDPFFNKLLQVENKNGQVKISHYGDSPITNDGITSTIRQDLQEKFGDAGHGYVLIDKPWGWYQHAGIDLKPGVGWANNPIFISKGDKFYGFGAVSFTTNKAGVTTTITNVAEGKNQHEVTHFDIYYLAQANGGDVNIELDGNFYTTLSTSSYDNQSHSAFYQVPVTKGQHKLTLKTVGNGEVRLFGITLENDSPGIQYDSLGVNGAYIGLLANYINEEHWVEQLRYRQPDLVIIGYGTNESQFESLPMAQYERDTKEVIRRIRGALPNVSIMLLAPMDRGARGAGGGIITRPMIPKLVDYQRRIAAETGCAFFDTFTAMGGEGTVAKWYETRPRLMGGDFTHPTAQGAEIVGNLISKAVLSSYERFKSNQLVKTNLTNANTLVSK